MEIERAGTNYAYNGSIPPDILRVSAQFRREETAHGSYQVYWGVPSGTSAGPYMVRLLSGAEELAKRAGIYGNTATVEADLPAEGAYMIEVSPDGTVTDNRVAVPGGYLCSLSRIVCESEAQLRMEYQFAEMIPDQMVAEIVSKEGVTRLLPFSVFENRIDLAKLGIGGTKSCTVGLGCSWKEGDTLIEEPPAAGDMVTVILIPPELYGFSTEIGEKCIGCSAILKEEGGGNYYFRLFGRSGLPGSEDGTDFGAVLSADKKTLSADISFSAFSMGLSGEYTISVVQMKDRAVFPKSVPLAVILDRPAVRSLDYASADSFRLQLQMWWRESCRTADGRAAAPRICRAFLSNGAALKNNLNGNDSTETVEFLDGVLIHPFGESMELTLAFGIGLSQGPKTEAISLKLPAWRMGTGKDGGPFLYYAPDAGYLTKSAITVGAVFAKKPDTAISAGAFTIGAADPKTGNSEITMAASVWPDGNSYDKETVRSDVEALLAEAEATGFGGEDIQTLRRILADRLPQPVPEQPFFRFGMKKRSCELLPGMRLRVETGRMQWSDDPDGGAFFAGISGGQRMELPVLLRGGKLRLDAFTVLLPGYADAFEQPDLTNYGRLAGGAGTVDLGRDELCGVHMRLHYPPNFWLHTCQGAATVKFNEWIAAADTLEILDRDTEQMELDGYLTMPEPESKQAYLVFLRGRVHMTPLFGVKTGESLQWVAVGTVLGDMEDALGRTLLLIRNGTAMPQMLMGRDARRAVYLAPGDELLEAGMQRYPAGE